LSATQQIIDRHCQHMIVNLPRYPIAMVRGQDCRLWDAEGKEYLDLFSGFGATILGHCHPDVVAAVTEQAGKLWHVGNLLHTEQQTRVAEAIWRLGFKGRSFFSHSGADANEAAIKLSRLYGKANPGRGGAIPGTSVRGRYKLITATKSFHGRSFGTMLAPGQAAVSSGFEPLAPGFSNVEYNSIDAIKAALDEQTVAILVEPIQGEGGIRVPDDDYLKRLRALCDENDLLLMFDEIWTGCGRTGRYFAHQNWGVEPDVMTLGKGVGAGLPVGVVCAKPRVAELFDYPKQNAVKHATTLGGNCLSMAASDAVFRVLERDRLPQRAEQLGERAMNRLRDFGRGCPAVKEVRGKGLFSGVELDPQAKGVWFKDATEVVKKCLERGLLINAAQKLVLRLAPPLTISEEQLDRGLELVEAVVAGR